MNPRITIGTQKGKEKTHDKLHYSPFGITINPNITTGDGTPMNDVVHDVLEYVAGELFGSVDAIKKIVKIIARDGSWNDIIAIDDINPTLEYGKQGRWHIQVFLGLHHKTMVRLDIPYMRKVVSDAFQVPATSIHINVETNYGRDVFANARTYPLKDRNLEKTKVLA